MTKYLCFLTAIFLGAPALLYGQSDLVQVMTPNAMIIFDTSSSMNSKVDGSAANPSWKQVDKDGNVFPDGTAPWNWYPFEGGGNHPDSKLYWAKLSLKKVITDLVNINLGFSTYAQFKTEVRRGYYTRDRWKCTGGQSGSAPTCTWSKLYWRWNNYRHYYSSSSSQPLGTFTDVWGQNQTGLVSIGALLYEKNHTFDDNTVLPSGNSVPPTYKADLTYDIYNIVLNAEMNVYTYYYRSVSHDHYEEQNLSVSKNPAGCLADCSNCNNSDCSGLIDCNDPTKDFKNPWPATSWKTFHPGDAGYSPKWKCSNSTFTCQKAISCAHGAKIVDYSWQTSAGTTCLDPVGTAKNYPAMDPSQGDAWTEWKFVDSCYDFSDYKYPTTNPLDPLGRFPDRWSYFRFSGGIWSDLIQPTPFYPSRDGGGAINDVAGKDDNHYFFINIPQVDDSTKGYPIKNAILALLDLTPVQSPEPKVGANYWTKLPIKLNSLTSNTSAAPVNQTPIADSLMMAKKYYGDYINQDAPSQAKCRGNYIILLTDGLESCRFKDPPKNLDPDFDAGTNASKDLYNIGVNTFVIGFGKAAGANIAALNNMARAGSNNKYDAFFTDTLGGLTSTLQTIFQIIGGSYGRSSPVVSRSRDRLYRGYLNLPGYEGHLGAYDLKPDGSIITPEVWDAGKVMNSNGRSPNIYTWVDGATGKSRGDFTDLNFKDKNNKKLEDYLNPLGEDINKDGKVDKKDSKAIDDFTLDANHDDGKNGPGFYKGVRSATWKLGDIYHSTALVVGAPSLNFPDIPAFTKKYSTFQTTMKNRETVVYVGANDGMLHAFSDKDGKEKFAIIPNNLLGKLKELRTNTHQFFVDSSPRAYDVFIGGAWSTVLVSGQRAGGNSYFALDVTDPKSGSYPTVLWDVTDPAMGDTWSRPEIGWVTSGGQEKFVAFVGGGYSTTDDVGNTFYVIDIADGSILRKFVVGGSKNKVPAGATAFDSDLDGRVNAVYFGDINGVLWKIKTEGDIGSWPNPIPLHTPAINSPVFYPPAVTKNNQGKILIFYGQGNETNIFAVDNNAFYEVWDNNDVGQLMWMTDGKNGRPQLEAGEKMLGAPAFANDTIYFTTWKYTGVSTDCGAGVGRLYGLTSTTQGPGDDGGFGSLLVDPVTGSPFLDKFGNPVQRGQGKTSINITDYFPKSKGIPSGPVVTYKAGDKSGFATIYISTSRPDPGAEMGDAYKIPGWGTGRLKYWREVF